MSDPITASMLIGAAVGGGSQLVRGKGLGDILKGGLIGGATGGITGGIGGAMGAGAGAGTGAVGEATKAGLGQGIALTTPMATDTALNFLPQAAVGNVGQGINLANATSALDYGFNPVMQNLSSTPLSLAGGGVTLPESISSQLALNNIGYMPNSFNEKLMGMYDKYGTVNNVTGAANAAMKYAELPKPQRLQAQQGQISKGQAPTLEGLLALQKMGYALPQNKKINFSLLG